MRKSNKNSGKKSVSKSSKISKRNSGKKSVSKSSKKSSKKSNRNSGKNNTVKNGIINFKNLKKAIEKNGKINANHIKYIEFGLDDILAEICNKQRGNIVDKKCRIDMQKLAKSMITVVEISNPANNKAKLMQKQFLNRIRQMQNNPNLLQMIGGGPVGCQNTHCPHNTRLVYDAAGTIHCDAPKWRGGQEMHYLLGAKY